MCHVCGSYYLYCGPVSLDSIYVQDNYDSLSWMGTYIWEEACNDCKKIQKRLTLKDDNNYELRVEYIGSDKPNIEIYNGVFTHNGVSQSIELYQKEGKELKKSTYKMLNKGYVYYVEEGATFGKAFGNELTDSLWYLCSLNGKTVNVVHVDGFSSEYIKFENDGHVKAQTKCGYYNGEFDIEDRNLVSVSNLNETKIPCNQDQMSTMYIRLFLNDFRYEIVSDTLYFRDIDSVIIAKFVR
jgi:heat shock protein HslJ